MAAKRLYKVMFMNQGKVYEIYARNVFPMADLFGFIEVAGPECSGNARPSLLIPSEERIQIRIFRRSSEPTFRCMPMMRIDRGREAGCQQDQQCRGWQRRTVPDAGLYTG